MSETPSAPDRPAPSEEGLGAPQRPRGGASKPVGEAVGGREGPPAGIDGGEIADSGLGAFYAYQMARSALELD